ncbi:MAG: hypothetical protein DMG35_15465 [Acidobacteria bacterium]|nr:MAG: hypothetical protein AUH86_05335 [Acidobacteria bacterium 13_1_40CM_4_58_4]PYT59083.1 MAG: hypothetical protein DMG35_15465 [Acidobacteriota bacterium]
MPIPERPRPALPHADRRASPRRTAPIARALHLPCRRLKTAVIDPEALAADLLADIDSFTTADEVNLFLGNLVKQLARKRIARRDAIALAYISQLILTSQTAMAREAAAEMEAVKQAEHVRLIARLGQGSRDLASLGNQQSTGAAPEHRNDDPQRPA